MGAFFFIHRPGGEAADAGVPDPVATKLAAGFRRQGFADGVSIARKGWQAVCYGPLLGGGATTWTDDARSEEHTSELQSLMRISYAVFCLKKKKKNTKTTNMVKH